MGVRVEPRNRLSHDPYCPYLTYALAHLGLSCVPHLTRLNVFGIIGNGEHSAKRPQLQALCQSSPLLVPYRGNLTGWKAGVWPPLNKVVVESMWNSGHATNRRE